MEMRPFFLEKQDAFAYFKVATCSHQSIVQVQWVSSSMFRSMPFVQKCEFFSVFCIFHLAEASCDLVEIYRCTVITLLRPYSSLYHTCVAIQYVLQDQFLKKKNTYIVGSKRMISSIVLSSAYFG